jgi:hypothetical protein
MNRTIKNSLLLLLAAGFVAGCNQDKETSVEKPKQTITLERAHQMYEAYQERFNAVTEFRQGQEDARYGWHSLEFYKNYIAYLEAAAKKVNIKVSGLRVYYVAYPDDERSGKQADYQTYIFVPTYFDKKTNTDVAFDPLYVDEKGNPLPIHTMITKGVLPGSDKVSQVFTSAMRTQQTERESSIANMAQMCKPNCNQAE